MKISNFGKVAFLTVCLVSLSFGTSALAYQNPTANAGPDLYVTSGQSTTLQGSGYDPQSSSLIYYWNCSGGNLSSTTIAQPTFTAPNTTSQNYTCSFTVTNSYSLSASDTMIVYVNNGTQIGGLSVQTNSPTYVQNNSATLNGTVSIPYVSGTSYVWFQYGTDTNYGNNTFQQTLSYPGTFFQQINNLSSNTTYHYRAVAQNSGSTVYGQDTTFNSSGTNNYYGTGILSVTKQVINLSSGNLNWQASVNAKPGDILSFAITMQASGQDIHNVVISDILPANLIYRGNLTVNASLNSGNPAFGINVGTIPANGIEVIAFQAQVAPATSFIYGTTTLTNTATITSSESGTQTASSSVILNNSLIYGAATTIETGLTNNPIKDSFFLPVLLIILCSWLYFSGNIYKFSDWLGAKIR